LIPLLIAVVVVPWSAASAAADDAADVGGLESDVVDVFHVTQTFDGAEFDCRMQLRAKRPGFRIYRLEYPSPVVTPVKQNNTIPADYYVPEGIELGRLEPHGPRRPAVVCLHILNGNYELVNMTCSVLASRGIPAIMFKLPYYGERSLPGGRDALRQNRKLLIEALSQGIQDVRRTVDVLAARPEIDPRRIGITGTSLGGIVAATSAGAEERIHRSALILSGGDLMQIIHHASETRELSALIRRLPQSERDALERAIRAIDPLSTAAALRDRAQQGRVLMINAGEDELIPKECTEKLAAALGISDRVVWLPGLGHYSAMASLPAAIQTTAEFFAEDLPPGVEPVRVDRRHDPPTVVVSLLQQAGTMLTATPKPGRCHLADVAVSVTLKDGKRVDGTLRLVRGSGHRLCLRVDAPKFAQAAFGQGVYPWMASGEAVVFRGRLAADAELRDPFVYADRQNVLKLRMVAGVLAALALAPDSLQTWVEIEEDTTADGDRVLQITDKRKASNRIQLTLADDGRTPKTLSFDVDGIQGRIVFRAWQLDAVAHVSLFAPPPGLPEKQVQGEDLYRMFGALLNFAVEKVE